MTNRGSSSQVRAPNLRPVPFRDAPSDDALIRGFLGALRADGRTEKTRIGYEGSLRALSTFAEQNSLPRLGLMEKEDVRAWLASLWDAKNKPATVHTRYRAAKRFFDWCVVEGERRDNPMATLNPPRIPEVIQPDYGADEVRKLLKAAASEKTVHSLRDQAIIRVLYDTGVRSGELVGMRVRDVDWNEQTILVTGKAGKQRRVGFGNQTSVAIERYLRRRGANTDTLWLASGGAPLSLNGLRMMLQRRFTEAGLDYKGAHAFRRGFAIAFLEDGGDPGDLKALAGWQSYAMLARYTKRTESDRAIKAHRRFSPGDRLNGR